MKFTTRMRTSSALWAAPFGLLIAAFYYANNTSSLLAGHLGHAPSVVSEALGTMYAFSYAIASGLGVWEGGKRREYGLWNMAPGRSRFRIAAHALLPVVVLAWCMLVLPVALALATSGTAPTAGSLLPLGMALVLCAAHASIGFGVGLVAPYLIAAPLMTALVWILVAFSWTVEPDWFRHLFGQYPTTLMFGEQASLLSVVPHLLLTGGIAASLWLMWLPFRNTVLRAGLTCAVALGAVAGSWAVVHTWSFNPPLVTRAAPEECSGSEPRVCMPRAAAGRLSTVHAELVSVLADLRAAGVPYEPGLVVDTLNDGRFSPQSTAAMWRIPLASIAQKRDSRYQLALASVQFSCNRPDPATAQVIQAWVARVTGEQQAHRRRLSAGDGTTPRNPGPQRRVERALNRVDAMSREEQAQWFRRSVAQGCARGG